LMESIGVVINTIEANSRTESLLTQSQSLAQELQQTNMELAEKARLLSEQNIEVERKNREVEQAKRALEEKAAQLALSSKYKSEFLANMSHELRTPLNSLLILAQHLSENPDRNLTDSQVEFAKTIYGSGSDLLTLINDILDLSKIESGTVTLELREYRFQALRDYVERTFRHMAEAKSIEFSITLDDNLPPSMKTDTTRLQQILKNLLSNAFKFTAKGRVELNIGLARAGWKPDHPGLAKAEAVLAFSVTDTGVGIAPDKLQLIFEAFQQADGSTARRYGGTGLGLSISRELARLLNGEIRVESELGAGSTFILFLPLTRPDTVGDNVVHPLNSYQDLAHVTDVEATEVETRNPFEAGTPMQIKDAHSFAHPDMSHDDRALMSPGDPAVLIVEDDQVFAKSLLDQAREKNFKGIVTRQPYSALALTRDYLPTAILLDIDQSEADGLAVLDRLKRDPDTRHIPVHVLSRDGSRESALRHGAASYLQKPVTPEQLQEELTRIQQFVVASRRNLLVSGSDPAKVEEIVNLLGSADVHIETAATLDDALQQLKDCRFDCAVIDFAMPGLDDWNLVEKIAADGCAHQVPLIVYSTSALAAEDRARISKLGDAIVLKHADSPERLVAEAAIFLHRPQATLPEPQRRMVAEIQATDAGLAGRKVLIVDDDLRNIFALSSVLEREQMKVLYAENGRDGIEVLQSDPSIEIVLMDIMMPEMDGYDTMRAIRRLPEFRSLPIITLTAKAMKGDRDKCIAAGASDYVTKPVDAVQLLSLMRVWLHS
jgi:signal transduction histidine kinase/DNA-binding response OmpR family regulator